MNLCCRHKNSFFSRRSLGEENLVCQGHMITLIIRYNIVQERRQGYNSTDAVAVSVRRNFCCPFDPLEGRTTVAVRWHGHHRVRVTNEGKDGVEEVLLSREDLQVSRWVVDNIVSIRFEGGVACAEPSRKRKRENIPFQEASDPTPKNICGRAQTVGECRVKEDAMESGILGEERSNISRGLVINTVDGKAIMPIKSSEFVSISAAKDIQKMVTVLKKVCNINEMAPVCVYLAIFLAFLPHKARHSSPLTLTPHTSAPHNLHLLGWRTGVPGAQRIPPHLCPGGELRHPQDVPGEGLQRQRDGCVNGGL